MASRLGSRLIQRPVLILPSHNLRPFTTTLSLAGNDRGEPQWQQREQIRPSANEYSKSASDADAAAVEDTAFSRDKTKPEEQLKAAGEESGTDGNPLGISPANKAISDSKDPAAEGAESSSAQSGKGPSDRQRSSGPGETDKRGSGQRYEK